MDEACFYDIEIRRQSRRAWVGFFWLICCQTSMFCGRLHGKGMEIGLGLGRNQSIDGHGQ